MNAAEASPAACDRCGDFGALIVDSGRLLCAECAEKARHPIVREAPTVSNVMRGVAELTRAVGPRAIGLTWLLQLFASSFDQLGLSPIIGFVAGWFGYSLSRLTTMHLAHQYVHGGKARVAAALSAVARRYFDVFFVELRVGVTVGFYTLLLVVPGISKSLDLKIATPVALFQSGLSPVRASTQWMFGHRGMALAATLLGYVPWLPVLVMAGLVGLAIEGLGTASDRLPWYGNLVVEALMAPAIFFPDAVTLVIYEKLTYLSTPRTIQRPPMAQT
jgi:hypothetical protein